MKRDLSGCLVLAILALMLALWFALLVTTRLYVLLFVVFLLAGAV